MHRPRLCTVSGCIINCSAKSLRLFFVSFGIFDIQNLPISRHSKVMQQNERQKQKIV